MKVNFYKWWFRQIFFVGPGIIVLILHFNIELSFAGRPLSTEDARVSGKWALSFEVGIDYAVQNHGDEMLSFLFVPICGLTRSTEISIELPYTFNRPVEGDNVQGLSDINLVLKTLIIPEGEFIPALLLKTQLKLSNGDEKRGLGSGDQDIGFVGALTKELGNLIIHANLGYTFVGQKKAPDLKDYILYGLACEYSLNEKLSIVGELYGESDSHFDIGSFKHHTINLLIGSTYKLSEKIVLDGGFRAGYSGGKKQGYGITFGASVEF